MAAAEGSQAHDDTLAKQQQLAGESQHDSFVVTASITDTISVSDAGTFPFLGLPAEIRNIIYELVLCGKHIHIGVHFAESPLIGHVVHTVCDEFRDWDLDYAMSKCTEVIDLPDAYSVSNASTHYIPKPDRVAASCERRTQLRRQRRKLDGEDTDDSIQQELEEIGPCRVLDFGIIEACKQTYAEARYLPYAGNTFIFRSPSRARMFAGRENNHQYCDYITRLYLYGYMDLSDLQHVVSAFRSLNDLKVGYLEWGYGNPDELKAKHGVRPVSKVEVIVNYDDKGEDGKSQSKTRQKRREKAAVIEKCLIGTSDDF